MRPWPMRTPIFTTNRGKPLPWWAAWRWWQAFCWPAPDKLFACIDEKRAPELLPARVFYMFARFSSAQKISTDHVDTVRADRVHAPFCEFTRPLGVVDGVGQDPQAGILDLRDQTLVQRLVVRMQRYARQRRGLGAPVARNGSVEQTARQIGRSSGSGLERSVRK